VRTEETLESWLEFESS